MEAAYRAAFIKRAGSLSHKSSLRKCACDIFNSGIFGLQKLDFVTQGGVPFVTLGSRYLGLVIIRSGTQPHHFAPFPDRAVGWPVTVPIKLKSFYMSSKAFKTVILVQGTTSVTWK